MPIYKLNLSLSNKCAAKCVFCPATRGTKHNIDMPFEIAKKVIDEASAPEFPWKIYRMELGENGEAIYNDDFLKILRYIREKLPEAVINMSNNFSMMKEDIAETILTERLFDSMQVNIDGHDAASYNAAKGINFNVVIRNLKKFLEIRSKVNPTFDLGINVAPLFEYTMTVGSKFKSIPVNLKQDVPYSSFEDIKNYLNEFVPEDVKIVTTGYGFWAERKLVDPKADRSMYSCPIINRVENEAFIAPNGDWYPCCLDDNQDQVMGNVKESTLMEIHDSERRNEFIRMLKAKEFDKIGYPCNTVECCQMSPYDKNIKHPYIKGDVIKF